MENDILEFMMRIKKIENVASSYWLESPKMRLDPPKSYVRNIEIIYLEAQSSFLLLINFNGIYNDKNSEEYKKAIEKQVEIENITKNCFPHCSLYNSPNSLDKNYKNYDSFMIVLQN